MESKFGSLTKRKPLLKLELSGTTQQQLENVGATLYNFDLHPTNLATNSLSWSTVDGILYKEARNSYDAVLASFMAAPKVYKLESTREKVWEMNRIQREEQLLLEQQAALKEEVVSGKLKRQPTKKIEAVIEEPTIQEQLDSYINPFAVTYTAPSAHLELVNRRRIPVEVWHEKLNLLEKLTPREDLEGYEYRESTEERLFRERQQKAFQVRLKEEVHRREQWPTEAEQVEDVLYDLVDLLCSRIEREEQIKANHEKKKLRSVYHPNTQGYKMRPLKAIESEDGQVTRLVSDAEFTDMVISITGHMLSLTTPPGLFEQHEYEREVLAEVRRKLQFQAEQERQKALLTKLSEALSLARIDPRAAAVKILDDVSDKLLTVPRRLNAKSKLFANRSKNMVIQGLSSLLRLTQDPMGSIESLSDAILRRPLGRRNKAAEIDSFIATLNREEKEQRERIKNAASYVPPPSPSRKLRNVDRNKPPAPITHADSVMVTLTLLLDAPPIHVLKPPNSWRKDLYKVTHKTYDKMREINDSKAHVLQRAMCRPVRQLSANSETSNDPPTAAVVPHLVMNGGSIDGSIDDVDGSADELDSDSEQPGRSGDDEETNETNEEQAPRSVDSASAATNEISRQNKKVSISGVDTAVGKSAAGIFATKSTAVPQSKTNKTTSATSKRRRVVDDQHLDLKKVLCRPTFDGHVKPADLVVKLPKGSKEKMVFDNSERRDFETKLVQELSAVVCLPLRNINIEQIRRLEVDSERLKELKQRSDELIAQVDALRMEERLKVAEDRALRKAMSEGHYLKYIAEREALQLKLKQVSSDIQSSTAVVTSDVLGESLAVSSEEQSALSINDSMVVSEQMLLDGEESVHSDRSSLRSEISLQLGSFPQPGANGTAASHTVDHTSGENESTVSEAETDSLRDDKSLVSTQLDPMATSLQVNELESVVQTHEPVAALATASAASDQEAVSVSTSDEVLPISSDHESQDESVSVVPVVVVPVVQTVVDATASDLESGAEPPPINGGLAITQPNTGTSDGDGDSNTESEPLAVTEQVGPDGTDNLLRPESEPVMVATGSNNLSGEETTRKSPMRKSVLFTADSVIEFDQHEQSNKLHWRTDTNTTDTNKDFNAEPVVVPKLPPTFETESVESAERSARSDPESLPSPAPRFHPHPNNSPLASPTKSTAKPVLPSTPPSPLKSSAAPLTSPTPAPIVISKAEPKMPELFKIGIPNPQDLKYDPHYWLAKNLSDLTDEEKRQYRIARLRLMKKETAVQARLKRIAELKDNLVEDAVDYFAPLVEQLQPFVDAVKPYAKKANKELLKRATDCFATLDSFVALISHGRGGTSSLLQEMTTMKARLSKMTSAIVIQGKISNADSANNSSVKLTQAKRSQSSKENKEDRAARNEVKEVLDEVCEAVALAGGDEPVAEEDLDFLVSIDQLKKQYDDEEEELQAEQEEEEAEEDSSDGGSDNGDDEKSEKGSETSGAAASTSSGKGPEKKKSVLLANASATSDADVDAVLPKDEPATEKDEGSAAEEKVEKEEESSSTAEKSVSDRSEEEKKESEDNEEDDEDEGDEEEENEKEEEEKSEDQASSDAEDTELSALPSDPVMESRKSSIAQLQQQEESAIAELSGLQQEQQVFEASENEMVHFEALREKRLLRYDADIVDLVEGMCMAVELAALNEAHDTAKQDDKNAEDADQLSVYSSNYQPSSHGEAVSVTGTVSSAATVEEEIATEGRLYGCEITLMIFVTDEQRRIYGLEGIEAEDVGALLKQQLYDTESPLYASSLLQSVVDVQYKLPFKKRSFSAWESFWSHLIHPAFFGYSTHKNVHSYKGDLSGRLESGLMMVNPVDTFTERNKLTFKALNDKIIPEAVVERGQNLSSGASVDSRTIDEESIAEESHVSLDLEVDELAAEFAKGTGRKLKIFRPNMESLTAKDILRLKRLHKAFEEQYEELMRAGLVDGKRLRPEQFSAMKDRDTAYRIYRTAKAKFNRQHKDKNDSADLPSYKVTHIDDAIFQGWVDEARKEDQQRLREKRLKAAKMKEILKQEAELRRTAQRAKLNLIEKFISLTKDPMDVEAAFQEEMKKRELQDELLLGYGNSVIAGQTERVVEDIKAAKNELKMAIISEEKKTRRLFAVVNHYAQRYREANAKPVHAVPSQPVLQVQNVENDDNDDLEVASVTEAGEKPEKTEKTEKTVVSFSVPGVHVTRVDSPLSGFPSGTQSGVQSGVQSGQLSRCETAFELLTASESEAANAIGTVLDDTRDGRVTPIPVALEPSNQSLKLTPLPATDSSASEKAVPPISEPPSTPPKPAIMSKSKTQSTVGEEQEDTSVPVVLKRDLMRFIKVANKAVRDYEEQLRLETKFNLKQARNATRERRKQTLLLSQANTAKFNRSGTAATTMTTMTSSTGASDESKLSDDDSEEDNGTDNQQESDESGDSSDEFTDGGDNARDDSGEALFRPSQVVRRKRKQVELTPAEFEFVRGIKWLRSIQTLTEFHTCLEELPSMEEDSFARDELIQFASTVTEVEPIFSSILSSIEKTKEAAEIAMGIKKSKAQEKAAHAAQRKLEREEKKKKRMHLAGDSPHAEDVAKGVAFLEQLENERKEAAEKEKQIALEALRKQAEREKAWFMAHPHKYIQHPNEIAFCIVCKEKEFDYWMKVHREQEKAHRLGFEQQLVELCESRDSTCRKHIETNDRTRLYEEAEELAAREIAAEEAKAASMSGKGAFSPSATSFKRSALMASMKKPSVAPLVVAEEEEEDWEVTLDKIKDRMRKVGLPFCDPSGRSILPTEPPKKVVIEQYVAPVLLDENTSVQAELGCKIRVWHRDLTGERANFLGMVHLTEEILEKPPKGIRTYPLKVDYAISETNPLRVMGSLTMKLNISHKEHRSGVNLHWTLDIKKLSGVATVDKELLTNPYCEVYWIGLAQRKKHATQTEGYVVVGQTNHKEASLSCEYHREEDKSYFELPPVWTDLDIPNRGLREMDVAKGGGWVCKNNLPEVIKFNDEAAVEARLREENAEMNLETKSGKKFQFGVKSPAELKKFREAVKFNELLTKETQAQLEILRLQCWAEEYERRAMGREERLLRTVITQAEIIRSQPLMAKQTEYSKQFMRLLQLLQSPPNILTRLRFLMGQESLGAGMKVMCEDPATNTMFTVITTPILYPEDEDLLCNQMGLLIGKPCQNTVKIVDFSVHQVRDFNHRGFSSTDERSAVIILDYYEGISVLKYLTDHWEELSDELFKDILCQIANGLKCLHEEGIYHRNVNPDCFILELPNVKAKPKKIKTLSRSATSVPGSTAVVKDRTKIQKPLVEKINIRVGEYWFLHNPRKPNCVNSHGRADWGNKMTAPPETLNNSANNPPMSDRSDIYGFGACVYHWCTGGKLWLPSDFHSQKNNFDALKTTIPLKWGRWLHSLLNMCLQRNPNQRASSQDIHTFLQSRFVK